jgi:Flp pilus assembly protein TadD
MAEYEQAVFISYAWGSERESIVNEIDESLQQRGIRIVRDKRALGYRGSIKEFMERIGRGSCVIVVISDKYLRSSNCMFELVEIAENKQFHDRIFPVVLGDANIYDPVKRIEYVKYWEAKRKELAKAMKGVDPANLHGIREEMDEYDRIRDKISGITSILKDMNTLTPDMHRDSEFSNLYDAIVERLRETSTDVTTEFNEMAKKAAADRQTKSEATSSQVEPESLSTSFMADGKKLVQASTLMTQGKQLLKDGKLQEAVQVFRQILTLMPNHEITLNLLAETEAKILQGTKDERQAKEAGERLAVEQANTERLVAQQKADQEKLLQASTLLTQGKQLLKAGDLQEAVRVFREILTLTPNHELTLHLLAETEAKILQEEEARAEAERKAKEDREAKAEAARLAAQNNPVLHRPRPASLPEESTSSKPASSPEETRESKKPKNLPK